MIHEAFYLDVVYVGVLLPKNQKLVLPLAEDPDNANELRAACLKCGLFETCLRPFMQAYVPDGWTGKLLVWGEGPGKQEDKAGRPFVGPAGKILFELLAEVGLEEKDVALTNSVRCRPPNNKTPNQKERNLCRPFAVHDVLSLRPEWVLVVGDASAKSVLGVSVTAIKRLRKRVFSGTDFFGSDGAGVHVAFTYHPASCLYAGGRDQRIRIAEDLSWLVSFKGHRDGPTDGEVHNVQIGLDIEWDKNYKLLTMARATGTVAEVTENPAEWSEWLQEASTTK